MECEGGGKAEGCHIYTNPHNQLMACLVETPPATCTASGSAALGSVETDVKCNL